MSEVDAALLDAVRHAPDAPAARRAVAAAMAATPDAAPGRVRILRRALARRLAELERARAPRATGGAAAPAVEARPGIGSAGDWRRAWLDPTTDPHALSAWLDDLWSRDADAAERLARLLDAREEWFALHAAGGLGDAVGSVLERWVRTGNTPGAREALRRTLPAGRKILDRIEREAPRLFAAEETLLRPLVDRAYAKRLARSSVRRRATPRRTGGVFATVLVTLWLLNQCRRAGPVAPHDAATPPTTSSEDARGDVHERQGPVPRDAEGPEGLPGTPAAAAPGAEPTTAPPASDAPGGER